MVVPHARERQAADGHRDITCAARPAGSTLGATRVRRECALIYDVRSAALTGQGPRLDPVSSRSSTPRLLAWPEHTCEIARRFQLVEETRDLRLRPAKHPGDERRVGVAVVG
jgi:hypothetical protein